MRKLLTLILFIALCLPLMAQKRLAHPEMYVGLSGGAVGSMIRFTPTIERKLLWGGNGGVTWRYVSDKYFGLQIEANYMTRGWKEKKTGYQQYMHYIEIPALCHIYFGRSVRGFINLGPKISFLLAYKASSVPLTDDAQPFEPWNMTPEEIEAFAGGDPTAQYTLKPKIFDYGICGGLGMEIHRIKNTRSCYYIEGRFNFSLSDIFPNGKKDYFSSSDHMNISINFGWLFHVKGGNDKEAAKTAKN